MPLRRETSLMVSTQSMREQKHDFLLTSSSL
jgi:hypothetical protein